MFKYVVVEDIPKTQWMSDGPSKLRDGGSDRVWGHRLPVAVRRVGKKGEERVSMKLKVTSRVVAADLVRNGATFLGIRKEVQLAVRGGGTRVLCPVGPDGPLLVGCFSCGDRGHVQHFCPKVGSVAVRNGLAGRC